MRLTTAALIALCGSCGFSTGAWAIVAWSAGQAGRWWKVGGYVLLIVACLLGTVVIFARLTNRPLDLPMGTTTFVLIPLVLIPAAISLHTVLESKRPIEVQLPGSRA